MRILIAEDDMTSRLVLGATLKKLGHEVVAVQNGREAWDYCQKETFSLLISDWMMPDLNGLELCRLIRSQRQLTYTYIILLTALGGKTNYLDAMDAGADDFITKPFDQEQLAARLRVAQRILDLHEMLRTHAMHDSLTGLYNRAAVMDSLSQELERAAREEKSVAVVLTDVDHFKKVNDTYGHPAGDAVLREVAVRLQSSLRSYDRLGRYGGEEFLMVLPGCGVEHGCSIAERVRHTIADKPIGAGENLLDVTASFGVTVSHPERKANPETLIQVADTALYEAKADGRNRVKMLMVGSEI